MINLGDDKFWERLRDEPTRLAAEVCLIDVVNIDQTLQRHASLRAWVNAALEAATTTLERCKVEEGRARATALLKAKETPDPHSNKAKTVEVLKAEVEVDKLVVAATDAQLDAQENRGALRAMANALEDRLQMLIQISAKHRLEIRDAGR